MELTITWQGIITAAAVLAAIIAIVGYYNKLFKWVTAQNDQKAEIAEIKAEQSVIVAGVLACLKGLAEQGCDGPVDRAINDIESYLNSKAHK